MTTNTKPTKTTLELTPDEKNLLVLMLETQLNDIAFERLDYPNETLVLEQLYKKITGTEY